MDRGSTGVQVCRRRGLLTEVCQVTVHLERAVLADARFFAALWHFGDAGQVSTRFPTLVSSPRPRTTWCWGPRDRVAAAAFDRLSNGRLIMGIASGDTRSCGAPETIRSAREPAPRAWLLPGTDRAAGAHRDRRAWRAGSAGTRRLVHRSPAICRNRFGRRRMACRGESGARVQTVDDDRARSIPPTRPRPSSRSVSAQRFRQVPARWKAESMARGLSPSLLRVAVGDSIQVIMCRGLAPICQSFTISVAYRLELQRGSW